MYKFFQQNVYIFIIKTNDNIISLELIPRILALLVNFVSIVFLETYLKSRTIKKVILATYTSLLVIFLYIIKDEYICELLFFGLNLNISESVIYNEFISLWQIQICLELSILSNYLSNNYIKLTINGHFLPIYILWIGSILVTSTRIKKCNNCNNCSDMKSVILNVNNNLQKFKKFVDILKHFFLLLTLIIVGCKTIKNKIFQIFIFHQYTQKDIIILLIIICSLPLFSYIMTMFHKRQLFILALIFIFMSYILEFLVHRSDKTNNFNSFMLDIISKKIMGLCKSCIAIIISKNITQEKFKKIKYRLIKFIILNSDAISYFINYFIEDYVNINIIVIILMIINIFIYCINLIISDFQ